MRSAAIHSPTVELTRVASASPSLLIKLWLLLLPITSVLLIPFIQGTTPGNLITLTLLLPMTHQMLFGKVVPEFYRRLAILLGLFLLSILLSQLALSFSHLRPTDLATVPMASALPGFYFRLSIFSQGLYLLAGFVTLVTFQIYYQRSWDYWLRLGVIVLALYGLYEVAFDLLFGRSGDFLTNRTFEGGNFSGSLEQRHRMFGVPLLRVKSLTGEASMYSLTVLPYLAFALHRRWVATSMLLIFTLILTVSTTGYFALAFVSGFAALRWAKARHWRIAVQVWAILLVVTVIATVFSEIFTVLQHVIVEKLSGVDRSGAARAGAFGASIALWLKGGVLTQLVGIGFGYIRSTDLFSSLLVNIGLLGLLAWVCLYVTPAWRLLRSNNFFDWRAAATLGILIAMLAGVPEFAYLAPWAFLGLSYRSDATEDATT